MVRLMKDEVEDLEIQLAELHGNLDEIKADIRISLERENWETLLEELEEYEDLLEKIQDLVSPLKQKVGSLSEKKKTE